MTGHSLLTKLKESSLSLSLTAALILVASLVVIISSITIQSAYMWLAVGATAVLFLGFCSCTTCEKSSQFNFARRGSQHSDSVSTISDGRDNFYEVAVPHNNPDYWITDLPPSYAVATAMSTPSLENQLPPPYSSVVPESNCSRASTTDSASDSRKMYEDVRNSPAITITIPTRTANGSDVTQEENNPSVC